MADVKISALPASTTPLAGTEVLPIVQGTTTKQVSIANVTAGRAVAALSITTATVQATNSGGLALKNSGGTTQISVGSGGGDNLTISVATNITPANAAVAISPTGTGTVAISPAGALTVNPTAASTINNTSIGVTTPLAGKFTTLESSGDTVLGTNAAKIFSSSGVSIGNTTDPGATNLSVTGRTISNNFLSSNGSVSALTATPTTLFAMSGANRGSYIVTALIANTGGPTQYIATATASWDGSGGKIVSDNGTNLTLTLSGGDVQVTQIAGSTQTVYWSYLYIGLL